MRTTIHGGQIRDDTVTGDDVDESTLILKHFLMQSILTPVEVVKYLLDPLTLVQPHHRALTINLLSPQMEY